jgi:hypothetical protein
VSDLASDPEALSLFAKLHVSLDGINTHLKRTETQWIQRATDMTRNVLVRFSATCPSPTAAFTLAGPEIGGVGPSPGDVWVLRACRVGGVTPTTTAAGRADLYQSPVDPTASGAAGNTANWIDQATALPLAAFYSDQQVVLRSPDSFFVVVTNGTASQQYVANAIFEVYHDGAYRSSVTL